jgi:hypothetical protein
MTYNILEYSLVDGFIHNWLVAGPQTLPQQPDDPQPALNETPVERVRLSVGDEEFPWAYHRCLDDHLIDLSATYPVGLYIRAWAYVQLVSPVTGTAAFNVFSSGPVQAWLNGQGVFRSPSLDISPNQVVSLPQTFRAPVQSENELLVSFTALAGSVTRHTLALQVADVEGEAEIDGLVVRIPTRAKYPHRHKIVENLFEHAYLENFVHHKGNLINIRWAEAAERTLSYSYKVQDILKQNYVTGNAEVKDEPYDAGHPQRIWERPLFVTLQAPEREYWEMDLRYERRLPLQVLDTEYAHKPRQSFAGWRKLALEHASRREPDLFAEIAKMVLGQWDKVNPASILQAAERINVLEPSSSRLKVGLLGMLSRFQFEADFPSQVTEPVESALVDSAYLLEGAEGTPESESQVILDLTAAILVGQRLPKRNFSGIQQMKGNALRQAAEVKARDWLRLRGRQGFSQWHSDLELEDLVLALTHLVSLAEDQSIRELAAVLLDKILFLLAVNSHQGVYGIAHRDVSAGGVKSGQMLAGTAINRLLFGVGVYNQYFAAPVSLACSEYEFPSFFAEIAANPPKELLHRERQVGLDGSEANLTSYRTPDFLLSSVQDYQPGQPGMAEHVWQATLGPDAVVFTNHPACMGEMDVHQPGFWLGNAVLPRIAQWKDNLVAIYNLPAQDWMGYTHAHFPLNAFDETVFARGWAFGRLREAFIGLTCSRGFEQVKQGVGAFRELRALGRQAVWLCVLGRQAVYDGFRKFQKKCMAIQPQWQALGVAYTSPQGDQIAFHWQGPLEVNSAPQSLSGFKHIENPYCAVDVGSAQMDIQHGEFLMRLNFD